MPTVRNAANGGIKIAMIMRMISIVFHFRCCAALKVACLSLLLQGTFSTNVEASKWSNTEPKVNLTHIFEGEINKRGRAVGFHARPYGRDPERAHLYRLISGPNSLGIYTGEAEIYDVDTDRWKQKAFSSFFPDKISKDQVLLL